MTSAICPYCRTKIEDESSSFACEGCGTFHHADCYTENGGCTIFGCSKAPADEPKLSVSTPELSAVGAPAAATVEERPRAPVPPPPPPGAPAPVEDRESTLSEWQQYTNSFVPSIFGGFESAHAPIDTEPLRDARPRSRTTFILLGALLGAFGAHSFYARDKKKGAIQLVITVLSLGLAGPMVWVWAVIDVCTINQDSLGVQFEA